MNLLLGNDLIIPGIVMNDCVLGNIIDILMVIGTFLAVVVALFGEIIQKKWFGPKLKLINEKGFGNLNTVGGKEIRFFHLCAINERNTLAHNAIVVLSKVEETWAGGKRVIWDGEVPMRWIYSEIYQSFFKNIGTDQLCDICSVSEQQLNLTPVIIPNNLQVLWVNECDIYLHLYIKSDEAVSIPIIVHIVWDGKWESGVEEMKKHFSLTIEQD